VARWRLTLSRTANAIHPMIARHKTMDATHQLPVATPIITASMPTSVPSNVGVDTVGTVSRYSRSPGGFEVGCFIRHRPPRFTRERSPVRNQPHPSIKCLQLVTRVSGISIAANKALGPALTTAATNYPLLS
jgi:hypothetical protein